MLNHACKAILQSCLITNPALYLCRCVMSNSNHYINWPSSHMFLKASSLILQTFCDSRDHCYSWCCCCSNVGKSLQCCYCYGSKFGRHSNWAKVHTVNLLVAKAVPDCLPRSQVSVRSLHRSSLDSSSMLVTVTPLSPIESNSALRQWSTLFCFTIQLRHTFDMNNQLHNSGVGF